MAKATIAIFCMPEEGHFKLLRPLISDLARWGFAVYVFTHRRFSPGVERAGATSVDLFAKHPLEQADSESIPIPCRYVSFAAAYAEEVLEELRRIRPVLVLYETFAVIGRLTAQLLGVPFVNVSPGHNLHPARHLPILRADPRVAISERCYRAVETLRERYGLSDASPFCYIAGLSPYLNICCQPAAFLTEEERKGFEPVAFYGCILSPADPSGQPHDAGLASFGNRVGKLKIYVCFGTVALRYYADAALGVFQAVSECLESMPDVRALISLGGTAVEDKFLRRLTKPNVKVVEYVDQWNVLEAADVFVTHHGINSTHEAIMRRVPMLSYPFFTDQPALAEKCRQFGIAIPLVNSLRGRVDAENVRTALETLSKNRESVKTRLEQARLWELEVIAQRHSVLERISDLASVTRRRS